MPLVYLEPKSVQVEDQLADIIQEIRKDLKNKICEVSGFPSDDVIVNLLFCPFRDVDPAAADVVIYADTCPDTELENNSNDLVIKLMNILISHGLSVNIGSSGEIWMRFPPGPWVGFKNGEIFDTVSHPR